MCHGAGKIWFFFILKIASPLPIKYNEGVIGKLFRIKRIKQPKAACLTLSFFLEVKADVWCFDAVSLSRGLTCGILKPTRGLIYLVFWNHRNKTLVTYSNLLSYHTLPQCTVAYNYIINYCIHPLTTAKVMKALKTGVIF